MIIKKGSTSIYILEAYPRRGCVILRAWVADVHRELEMRMVMDMDMMMIYMAVKMRMVMDMGMMMIYMAVKMEIL